MNPLARNNCKNKNKNKKKPKHFLDAQGDWDDAANYVEPSKEEYDHLGKSGFSIVF